MTATGSEKRRTVYGSTKREVQEKIQALQGQAFAGSLTSTARLTVGEYLDRWLANTAKSTVQPTSYARYERLVRMQIKPSLGRIRLTGFTSFHVENFYSEMARAGVNARTSRMAGGLLTNALNHAVRPLKLISVNPAVGIKKARPDEIEMQFLTDAQARLFLETARTHRLVRGLFARARFWDATGRNAGLTTGPTSISTSRPLPCPGHSLTWTVHFSSRSPRANEVDVRSNYRGSPSKRLREHRQVMLREGNISGPVFCTQTASTFSIRT